MLRYNIRPFPAFAKVPLQQTRDPAQLGFCIFTRIGSIYIYIYFLKHYFKFMFSQI
jgi:hypothetical protein